MQSGVGRVSRVHRLEKCLRLDTSDLTKQDVLGSLPHRRFQQIEHGDIPLSSGSAGCKRHQTRDPVVMIQHDLAGILDGNHLRKGRNELGNSVQGSGFSRSRPSDDQNRVVILDRHPEIDHLLNRKCIIDQQIDRGERIFTELADRKRRTAGRDHRTVGQLDTRPVGQGRVHDRIRKRDVFSCFLCEQDHQTVEFTGISEEDRGLDVPVLAVIQIDRQIIPGTGDILDVMIPAEDIDPSPAEKRAFQIISEFIDRGVGDRQIIGVEQVVDRFIQDILHLGHLDILQDQQVTDSRLKTFEKVGFKRSQPGFVGDVDVFILGCPDDGDPRETGFDPVGFENFVSFSEFGRD